MKKADFAKLKTATKKLSQWESFGKAFGHFVIIESKGADKIYEFFCLMKILKDFDKNYFIKLHPGTITKGIFPGSPSNKGGWPYFELQNKANPTEKYQMCYGTNIKLSKAPKTTFAPDISIQKHDATHDPDETMVELIMDAKFKFDSSQTILVNQVHTFIQIVNALQTQNADKLPLAFDNLNFIKSNCLLTNGKVLHGQSDYCLMFRIKLVGQFDLNGFVDIVG